MAFDKATILELLEGMDPHMRSRLVTSLVEGTSPEERERIIDRATTKKVSPYTSDRHTELMELALNDDEDLANTLSTWIKKPANQEWFEMMLEEDTLDPSTVVGGAQLEGDRGYFDTMRENPLGIQGIIQALGQAGIGGLPGMAAGGISEMLRRGGWGLRDLDEAAGMAEPASELEMPMEGFRRAAGDVGSFYGDLGKRAMGGIRGLLNKPSPEVNPEDLNLMI